MNKALISLRRMANNYLTHEGMFEYKKIKQKQAEIERDILLKISLVGGIICILVSIL